MAPLPNIKKLQNYVTTLTWGGKEDVLDLGQCGAPGVKQSHLNISNLSSEYLSL